MNDSRAWSLAAATALLLGLLGTPVVAGPALPRFDFTRSGGLAGWEGAHDVGPLWQTAEGLVISIRGADPFIISPARDYPEDQPLSLLVRLKSDQGGVGQVFYFQDSPQEAKSIRFPVRADTWDEVRVPLPPLGARYRLRLDPPGAGGTCVLSSLAVEARARESAPAPTVPAPR